MVQSQKFIAHFVAEIPLLITLFNEKITSLREMGEKSPQKWVKSKNGQN